MISLVLNSFVQHKCDFKHTHVKSLVDKTAQKCDYLDLRGADEVQIKNGYIVCITW